MIGTERGYNRKSNADLWRFYRSKPPDRKSHRENFLRRTHAPLHRRLDDVCDRLMGAAQGFAVVPNWLVRDTEIPPLWKVVYLVLSSHVTRDDSWYMSYADIAAEAGVSMSTVEKAVKGLRNMGVIDWTERWETKPGKKPARLPHAFRVFTTPPVPEKAPPLLENGTLPSQERAREEPEEEPEEDTFTADAEERSYPQGDRSARTGPATPEQRAWLQDLHRQAYRNPGPLHLPDELTNQQADDMIREALAVIPRGRDYQGSQPGDPGFDEMTPAGQEAARRRLIRPRSRRTESR